MKLLIVNCHTNNRGDEAAVRALVDNLISIYPNISITLSIRGGSYPNLPKTVNVIRQYIPSSFKRKIEYCFLLMTKGKFCLTQSTKNYLNEVKKADLVIGAPGGPSIGDIYYSNEMPYLRGYNLLINLKKPYMFFAPSMGPFKKKQRNHLRIKVLKKAQAITLRDPISQRFVKDLDPNIKTFLALDSAFQFDFNVKDNQQKIQKEPGLIQFLNSHKLIVGITVTDLKWHPEFSKDTTILNKIKPAFKQFFSLVLSEKDIGFLFIPQLFGPGDDYSLMNGFGINSTNFYTLPTNDKNIDCYFQQYLISQLFSVIGMRYHSNIFSAKAGTPFISISYEQKMTGFMEKEKLSDFCIPIQDLSSQLLKQKFDLLCNNYGEYKKYLTESHNRFKKDSMISTEILEKVLSIINGKENSKPKV